MSNSWPHIKLFRFYSYFIVASFTVLIYEWVLAFGQEIELVWTKHWSLMTILYLSLRCTGIISTISTVLWTLPSVSLTDTSCTILYNLQTWISVFANAVLGVIIIIRLHAMYERSRKILVFLVVFLLAATITFAVINGSSGVSGEETVFYGIHQCSPTGGSSNLGTDAWGIATAWELTTLFLAVWIVVKHLRELKQPLAKSTLGTYFRVLIETHALYFIAYAAVACLNLGGLSPSIGDPLGVEIYFGILQLAQVMQMFILGPRLILSIRKYHAKEITQLDERTDTSTMVFQELTQKSTGSSV